MLSNAAFGGALAAVYLTLLVLHLNPAVPLTTSAVVPLVTTLALLYGIHIAVVLYAAYVLRQVVAVEASSPGWLSLQLLTWSGAALASLAAAAAWFNARGFRTALEPSAFEALAGTSLVLAACAVAFVLLAATHAAAPVRTRGGARLSVATLFSLVVLASIAVPLALRGPSVEDALGGRRLEMGEVPEQTQAAPRVVLLMLDGASLDVISPAVAEGRLPNFGRLLDGGASMHLATVRPTQPEPVWAAVVTGKWPPKNGIRSAGLYRTRAGGAPLDLLPDFCFAQALVRFGLLVEEPHLASAFRTRPLWHILTGHGVSSGIIGAPLTHPAEPVHGFIVSDHFHRMREPAIDVDDGPTVYPPELIEAARESLRTSIVAGSDPVQAARMLLPANGDSGVAALVADSVHEDLASRLPALRDVRLLVLRYPGVDAVGHYSLRYANPRAFGDVQEDERRRFGRVLDDYYGHLDTLVGRALASLQRQDLLLVASGFGMEPLTLGKRMLERLAGNVRFSGTHERAPDGFLLAYGAAVAPRRVTRGSLVDVTPTILYFLGLPVGRDMDGSVRTDVFNAAFNAQRTITFIPTYDR